MTTLNATPITVLCPHCGNRFNPEDAIGHDIRVQMEKEFALKLEENRKSIAARIRQQEAERYANQVKALQEDSVAKTQRLRALEEQAVNLKHKEQMMRQREESFELEMKRRLLERTDIIKEEAERTAREKALLELRDKEQQLKHQQEQFDLQLKRRIQEEAERVREEEKMKHAETMKKLEDQVRLVNEMKRKSEQGSMQMQGEVQELALEDYLKSTFPRDEVEEIAKGKRGGDCVHLVKDHYDRICGRILYESKRTKHFSYEWIAKVKDDMRLKQADLGVIVTEALPDGMTRFGEIEGIWVCTFVEFKALALLFRFNLARIGEVLASQENKGDKMQMIYSYITGVEFKQKLEAAFESYSDMQDDLNKEKSVMMTQWAKREKRLFKAMENLVALYGDVRGIAGGAVQEIHSLEMNEMGYLED